MPRPSAEQERHLLRHYAGAVDGIWVLGCHCLPKPFQLEDLLDLIKSCEKHIPADRELAPVEELYKTMRSRL